MRSFVPAAAAAAVLLAAALATLSGETDAAALQDLGEYDDDASENAWRDYLADMEQFLDSGRAKRGRFCLGRDMTCPRHSKKDFCCRGSQCSCNIFGQNCKCSTIGLFQRLG